MRIDLYNRSKDLTKVLPQLIMTAIKNNHKLMIVLDSHDKIVNLSNYLWSNYLWIPNEFDYNNVYKEDQLVWLTDKYEQPCNLADIVILCDQAIEYCDSSLQFSRMIFIFNQDNKNLLQKSVIDDLKYDSIFRWKQNQTGQWIAV